MVFEVLCSMPSDITDVGNEECVPRDVSSFKVFHKPEGLLLFSFIKVSLVVYRLVDLHLRTLLFTKQRSLRYDDQWCADFVFCAFLRW